MGRVAKRRCHRRRKGPAGEGIGFGGSNAAIEVRSFEIAIKEDGRNAVGIGVVTVVGVVVIPMISERSGVGSDGAFDAREILEWRLIVSAT